MTSVRRSTKATDKSGPPPTGVRVNAGRALFAGGEGFVGGAKERSGFVEDDGDGDIAEEAFEFPFVFEGVKENSVFHFFENFDGDATGDVDTAEGENFQREISGFG